MVEHIIKTWEKLDGSWDVTHHREPYNNLSNYLYDIPKDFRNLENRKKADEYAQNLFKRFCRKNNSVTLRSPDLFGEESPTIGLGGGHCWKSHKGSWYIWKFKNGKITKTNS